MTAVPPTAPPTVAIVSGLELAGYFLEFIRDRLGALRKAHADYGPFIVADRTLPFFPAKPIVLTAGAPFNRAILGNPTVWRTVGVVMPGPTESAQSRLRKGIVQMNGRKHAHYRRLISPVLERSRIEELGGWMIQIARSEVGSWPIGRAVDLWPLVQTLMRRFAISILFGNDIRHGNAIAGMLRQHVRYSYQSTVMGCPVDLPGTPYRRMLEHSTALERRICDWVIDKRQTGFAAYDLLSVLANSPDDNGNLPSDETVAAHVPTLFGASFETCQSALIWTLVLVIQHPHIARALLEELKSADEPDFDQISRLPLLDAIINESMRVIPPVPLQFRVSTQPTDLQGYRLPEGTRACLNAFLTNRSADLYCNPDRFEPHRWFSINPSTYEYLTFSAGARACPGFWFGRSVLKVALTAIMLHWRLAIPAGTRVDYKVNIAMEPSPGVRVEISPQDGRFLANRIKGKIKDLVAMLN